MNKFHSLPVCVFDWIFLINLVDHVPLPVAVVLCKLILAYHVVVLWSFFFILSFPFSDRRLHLVVYLIHFKICRIELLPNGLMGGNCPFIFIFRRWHCSPCSSSHRSSTFFLGVLSVGRCCCCWTITTNSGIFAMRKESTQDFYCSAHTVSLELISCILIFLLHSYSRFFPNIKPSPSVAGSPFASLSISS